MMGKCLVTIRGQEPFLDYKFDTKMHKNYKLQRTNKK